MTTANVQDSVKNRAFELFEERGGSHGNDQDDWFRAETELNGGNGSANKSLGKAANKRKKAS
jgi:hypothetical protein